jgi:hypothetical protein
MISAISGFTANVGHNHTLIGVREAFLTPDALARRRWYTFAAEYVVIPRQAEISH